MRLRGALSIHSRVVYFLCILRLFLHPACIHGGITLSTFNLHRSSPPTDNIRAVMTQGWEGRSTAVLCSCTIVGALLTRKPWPVGFGSCACMAFFLNCGHFAVGPVCECVYFTLVAAACLIISTSAIHCLIRLVFKTSYNVLWLSSLISH